MPLRLAYKGFNYVDYYNGEYSDNRSVDGVVQTGASGIALTPDWGINIAASTVYAGRATTDSLSNLAFAIKQGNAVGLTSMVRPLVDILYEQKSPTQTMYYVPGWGVSSPDDVPAGVIPAKVPKGADTTSFRGFIRPDDLDIKKFFGSPKIVGSYDSMIFNEAKVAQAAGAKLFAIGTELDSLATDKDPAVVKEWTTLIADVRKVFKGKLTYSANWLGSDKVTFWDKLDYVGIDGYVPLSNVVPKTAAQNPSLADLEKGWSTVSKVTLPGSDETVGQALHNLSAIDYFDKLAAKSMSGQFIFTEIGFQNDTEAAADPTGSSHSGVTDPSLQARLYESFFGAWQKAQDTADAHGGKVGAYNYALAGAYMWDWNPDITKAGYDDWATRGYPANDVITKNFAAGGVTRTGTAASQTLAGTVGKDVLLGLAGNDTLVGYAGNDLLVGGAGADRLSGGAGTNVFRYQALSDSTVASGGRDRITDFTAGDKIDLRALEAATGEHFSVIKTAAFSHHAGEIRYASSGADTVLLLDTAGHGTAGFAITLDGHKTVGSANLVL